MCSCVEDWSCFDAKCRWPFIIEYDYDTYVCMMRLVVYFQNNLNFAIRGRTDQQTNEQMDEVNHQNNAPKGIHPAQSSATQQHPNVALQSAHQRRCRQHTKCAHSQVIKRHQHVPQQPPACYMRLSQPSRYSMHKCYTYIIIRLHHVFAPAPTTHNVVENTHTHVVHKEMPTFASYASLWSCKNTLVAVSNKLTSSTPAWNIRVSFRHPTHTFTHTHTLHRRPPHQPPIPQRSREPLGYYERRLLSQP